jgi:hypothetical protein
MWDIKAKKNLADANLPHRQGQVMEEKKQARPAESPEFERKSLPIFVFAAHFGQVFLYLANTLLDFAFDFLTGVTLHGTGDFVGFALDLFHFPGNFVFASHSGSPCKS